MGTFLNDWLNRNVLNDYPKECPRLPAEKERP